MLSRLRKATEDKDQGFTLIELLVVIIIIGILAAIAIPVFLNQRKKGVDASVKSDLKNAANLMETYFTDAQSYGSAGSGTVATALVAGDFKSSPNNTMTVSVSGTGVAAGTFCLASANPGGTTTTGLYYDSDKGGLLPTGTVCS